VRDGKIGERTWPPLLALDTGPAPPAPPAPTPIPTPTPVPTPTPIPAVRVRQDVWTLSAANPWHPTLLWYARGVGALKARSITDPRSWRHLAETHGTSAPRPTWPPGARWKQCEHFSWHFLPWHRGYLHHFERIMLDQIIALGGPSDWALPFWNYSDTSRPDVRRIPPAFRPPTLPDGTPNALFESERAPGINGGARMLTDVSTDDMMRRSVFTPALGLGNGFGGTRAPVGSHRGAGGSQAGALEDVPHGTVHVAVGGDGPGAGLMSTFERAAQDPIFWLHHANVDRLWEAWLVAGRGNRNPSASAWMDDGRWVFGSGSTETTVTTRQMLDPRRAPLGYRYSDMPATPARAGEGEWFEEPPEVEPEDEGRPPELVGASSGPVALGPGSSSARVPLGSPSGPAAERLRETGGIPTGVNVFLRLENITGTVIHTSGVVVYVNIPAGGRPADFPDRKAGVVSMFGVIETSRRDDQHSGSGRGATFDITRIARGLAAAGHWDPRKLDVTFVPIPDATGRVGTGDVRVGRVSVFYA
jgi:tyrosinase